MEREDRKRLNLDQVLDTTTNSQSKRDQEVAESIKRQGLQKGNQARVTTLPQVHTSPKEFNHSTNTPEAVKLCPKAERCHPRSKITQVLALTAILTHLHSMLASQILEGTLADMIMNITTGSILNLDQVPTILLKNKSSASLSHQQKKSLSTDSMLTTVVVQALMTLKELNR